MDTRVGGGLYFVCINLERSQYWGTKSIDKHIFELKRNHSAHHPLVSIFLHHLKFFSAASPKGNEFPVRFIGCVETTWTFSQLWRWKLAWIPLTTPGFRSLFTEDTHQMRLNQLTPEDFELTPGESRPDSLFHFSTRQQFLFLGWKVYLSSIPQSLDRREGVDSALRSWNQRLHQSEPAVDIGCHTFKKNR